MRSDAQLFWFRTRDDLLEEWGYAVGRWHLVRRSQSFLTALELDESGQPLHQPDGQFVERPGTSIPLALIDDRLSELFGPADPSSGILPPGPAAPLAVGDPTALAGPGI